MLSTFQVESKKAPNQSRCACWLVMLEHNRHQHRFGGGRPPPKQPCFLRCSILRNNRGGRPPPGCRHIGPRRKHGAHASPQGDIAKGTSSPRGVVWFDFGGPHDFGGGLPRQTPPKDRFGGASACRGPPKTEAPQTSSQQRGEMRTQVPPACARLRRAPRETPHGQSPWGRRCDPAKRGRTTKFLVLCNARAFAFCYFSLGFAERPVGPPRGPRGPHGAHGAHGARDKPSSEAHL